MADRSLTRRIAALGTLAVVAYAALAAVQILVLNPLAAVPDPPTASGPTEGVP